MHNAAASSASATLHPHSTAPATLSQSASDISDRFSTPELISSSPPSPRRTSRTPSPFVRISPVSAHRSEGGKSGLVRPRDIDTRDEEGDWERFGSNDGEEDSDLDMPSDLRPGLHRHHDGQSQQPLLGKDSEEQTGYDSPTRPAAPSRRSTSRFHERDPELAAKKATRKRYTFAAFFLVLSLVSFCVQTEAAVYIQSKLGWKKAYCMLYFTHGSWTVLWFVQLGILRLQRWNTPWSVFWRRHKQILTQTAQMVRYQTLHPIGIQATENPWPHMIRTTALVTCALTFAGSSWYIAVNLTTSSDLTAIYNCSAFFAYVFSVPLLREKVKASKVIAVAVAIAGVLVVTYGGTSEEDPSDKNRDHPYRFLGNVIIGIGSVLYGFYEVLYKKVACPPEECSPGRGMIFANAFGSMIGIFTLTVLWIPLPILHFMGWEAFELPHGEAVWMLLVSVLSNAVFSGSFLILISLTSPVLSSVAALLTIFIIAIVNQVLPPPLYSPLSVPAIVGGLLIIVAFIVLSWATYQEMGEEQRKKMEAGDVAESDIEDLEDD